METSLPFNKFYIILKSCTGNVPKCSVSHHHRVLTFCLAVFANKHLLNVEIAHGDFSLENILSTCSACQNDLGHCF